MPLIKRREKWSSLNRLDNNMTNKNMMENRISRKSKRNLDQKFLQNQSTKTFYSQSPKYKEKSEKYPIVAKLRLTNSSNCNNMNDCANNKITNQLTTIYRRFNEKNYPR